MYLLRFASLELFPCCSRPCLVRLKEKPWGIKSLDAVIDKLTKLYGNNKAARESIAIDKGMHKKKYTAIVFYKLQKVMFSSKVI